MKEGQELEQLKKEEEMLRKMINGEIIEEKDEEEEETETETESEEEDDEEEDEDEDEEQNTKRQLKPNWKIQIRNLKEDFIEEKVKYSQIKIKKQKEHQKEKKKGLNLNKGNQQYGTLGEGEKIEDGAQQENKKDNHQKERSSWIRSCIRQQDKRRRREKLREKRR
ncbi:MAG: hypothetical protein EZS28_047546 [Streblomastix strix]|uniref:Uncharacterized protein n=1 Tax=Streblomastix strix TaxID=222440 RepID=A0A5J4TFJ3_9EUKA|nr:MAG: hypothetical protein EZS28_047546 [Streblomastix strix]